MSIFDFMGDDRLHNMRDIKPRRRKRTSDKPYKEPKFKVGTKGFLKMTAAKIFGTSDSGEKNMSTATEILRREEEREKKRKQYEEADSY